MMEAKELFVLKNGAHVSAEVWYCQNCRTVSRTEDEAEKCCRPLVCVECGAEVPRRGAPYGLCASCLEKRHEAEERNRFDKAKKLTIAEYGDCMVTLGRGDDYIDLDDLRSGEHGKPTYVYAVRRDAIKLREIREDDLYSGCLSEGFFLSDLPGIDDLMDAIDEAIQEWNAKPNESYEEDPTVVVLIPDDFYESEDE